MRNPGTQTAVLYMVENSVSLLGIRDAVFSSTHVEQCGFLLGTEMARARNIKPAFFTNELLGTLDPIICLTFSGLWCLADKMGILEDRPLRIKAELFPYRDSLDVNGYLTELSRLGFIVRYENSGKRFIHICNFRKHQSPHHTEKAKGFPFLSDSNSLILADNGYATVMQLLADGEQKVPERSDSLIHDSLNHDSGFTDSLIPDSLIQKPLPSAAAPVASGGLMPAVKPKRPAAQKTESQQANADTWNGYANAYFARYDTEPVRNAKTNSLISQLVQRLGAEAAPHVAAYFVGMNKAYYVNNLHAIGLLVKDCESIHTQWATNRQMTDTRARQIDQTQSNYNTADEAYQLYLQAQGGDHA